MRTPLAIYPGTFDPITNGHIDVVLRATRLFSRVIVLVGSNPAKNPLFTVEERVAMVTEVFKRNPAVETDAFEGLLVDYARRRRASVIIRGLRAVSDFEYEFQMALMNRKLQAAVDTIFLVPHENFTYLNSTLVREVARLGGDVSGFVPPSVRKRLLNKLSTMQ